MGRFVTPQVVRLTLKPLVVDGVEQAPDWIDVKKELNAGEQRRVFGKLVKEMRAGEKPLMDAEMVGLTKITEYLVDWSLTDASGKKVPVSEGAVNSLDGDTYTEIVKLIDAHEEETERAIEARKNVQAGEKASSPISPSVAG